MIEKSIAIAEACFDVTNGKSYEAISFLKREYPFVRHAATARKYSPPVFLFETVSLIDIRAKP